MGLLSVIRKLRLRQGVPIRETAQRTGRSRNTIKKYLKADVIEPHFLTPERPSKLDPFAEKLAVWLIGAAGLVVERRAVKSNGPTSLPDRHRTIAAHAANQFVHPNRP